LVRLLRPTDPEIVSRLASHGGQFSYTEVGATRLLESSTPADLTASYNVDHHEFDIGRGPESFARARDALMSWRHFDIPWLELHGADCPVRDGQVVATLVSVFGVWFLNPCRVVYAVQSEDPELPIAEFAYGTLGGHAAQGEERFRVRLDPATQRVKYEIDAFSRPAILLAKLGAPFVRRLQRRFASSSADALVRAAGQDGVADGPAGTRSARA
jgi:uncharacterized protein (UPF0548 family)